MTALRRVPAYSRSIRTRTTPARGFAALLTLSLAAASCSSTDGDGAGSGTTSSAGASPPTSAPATTAAAVPATVTTAATSTTTTTTTTTVPERDCTPEPGVPPARLDDSDPVAAAVRVSRSTFPCADHVTVVPAGDPAAAAAADHAVAAGGPLLLIDGTNRIEVAGELARLEPEVVTVAGAPGTPLDALAGYPIRRLTETAPPVKVVASDRPTRLWIIAAGSGATSEAVRVAAAATGDAILVVEGEDLRAMAPADRSVVREIGEVTTTFVGSISWDAPWQLSVVRAGAELPGGGLLLFPGRRLVAFYGSPLTPVLGVLGEQGPHEAADRLAPIVAEYETEGVTAAPAFEIIATIADSRPGGDGNYSNETDVEALRPWIEAARERGVYVILDLQPGRTDFLTQAKLYEEFLREPHVGLAIDPEWRLGPDQVHLQQIGTVDAAEINTVVEWLAGIVRAERLPQKLLLLHQFRLSMITNRDRVTIPPELAVVVQADGQGAIAAKYETWAALTAGGDAAGFWWGWKNFYDEDIPTPTPEQVLALEPVVHYVSYQ